LHIAATRRATEKGKPMSKNAPKKTLRKHRAMYETAGQTIRAGLWTQEYAAYRDRIASRVSFGKAADDRRLSEALPLPSKGNYIMQTLRATQPAPRKRPG
jgi:hypothetical protein